MRQTFYLAVSVFLVSIVSFMVLQTRKGSNLIFPDFGATLPQSHQILGIDVSHHQGHINWELALAMTIKRDSISFIYLKLTEGTDFKDEQSEVNLNTLSKTIQPYGVYHFFRPNKSAIAQANYFIKHCPKTILKPVLDIELQGELNAEPLVDSVLVFLDEVEKQLKVRPMIYTYESFYNDFFKSSILEPEWFWIANYSGKSRVFNNSNTIVWQFSENGTVDGITEKVDLNTAKPNFWEVSKW